MTQRLVAVFHLLKQCGESDPASAIVELLRQQNIMRSTSKIREAVAIYEGAADIHSRADALISPENLPEFWLQKLGELNRMPKSALPRWMFALTTAVH